MSGLKEPKTRREKISAVLGASRWPLLALLPAVVAGLAGFAGMKTGQTRTYFILATVFVAFSLAFLNVSKEFQAQRARRSARSAKAALAGSLSLAGRPLVTILGKVAESGGEDRRAEVKTLITLTLQIAAAQCGRFTDKKCQVRSVLYQFESDDRLIRTDWQGRGGKAPRVDFDKANSSNDREVISIAKGEDYVLCYDTSMDAPPYMDKIKERPYRSFLQVPVRTDERSFGFLSVDSDVAYTLTEADVGYITLMARLLAATLALVDGGTTASAATSVPPQKRGSNVKT